MTERRLLVQQERVLVKHDAAVSLRLGFWSSQMCGSLEMSSKQMAKLFVSFVTATERRLGD